MVIRITKSPPGWAVQVGSGIIPGIASQTRRFDTKQEAIQWARSIGDGTERIVADKSSSKIHKSPGQRQTEVIRQGR